MSDNFAEKKKQLESLESSCGISFILNEGYKILGNPIAMFDTSYNLLTYVDGIATDDWLWNEIISLGTFSHETVDFFNKEGFIAVSADAQIASLMKSDKLKYDRINAKLFDKDGVQLANIIVVSCYKPFDDGDMKLIELLSETLSVALQNSEFYQRIDRVYQESMLNDLIDGTIQDNEVVKAKIAELREELKPNLYLAVVDITQYEHTITHLAYFRDLFRKMQPEYRYYIHLNNIVAIISTDEHLSIKRDLSILNNFFAKYKIYAGISGCFHDLLEAQKYHREAIRALNYGLSGMRDQQIFVYDDYGVEHFLNSVKHTADINEMHHPAALSMQKHDRENNASPLEVLYTYLLYGKDAAITCEAMGISRDKLEQQLQVLENTFGIDWKDGDMLFNLFISIKKLGSLLT